MSILRYIVLALIGLMILALTWMAVEVFYPRESQEQIVRIHAGDNARVISNKLEQASIITSAAGFRLVARLRKADRDLKPGVYVFGGRASLWETVSRLWDGRSESIRITFPEGWSLYRTLKRIEQSGLMDYKSLYAAATDTALVRSLTGMKLKSLEGFLYPDTYQFPIDCGADSILGLQTAEFFRKLTQAGINPNEISDFYQKLILASIIEKEAGNDDERGIIAGVFQNRLKLGMALQSCPTVDYILEQRGIRREVLTTNDTGIPSPYNTYLNPGLPPTPICNPRIESIQAALNPAKHKYLYFFSDRQGNNVFSSSYEEHQRLQRKLGV